MAVTDHVAVVVTGHVAVTDHVAAVMTIHVAMVDVMTAMLISMVVTTAFRCKHLGKYCHHYFVSDFLKLRLRSKRNRHCSVYLFFLTACLPVFLSFCLYAKLCMSVYCAYLDADL